MTTAGYQGTPAPDQWFGGPELTTSAPAAFGGLTSLKAGSMVLRDAAGLVVDSLNYGGLVDPWAAEGYQADLRIRAERLLRDGARPGGRLGADRSGCRVQYQRGPLPGWPRHRQQLRRFRDGGRRHFHAGRSQPLEFRTEKSPANRRPLKAFARSRK